MIQQYQPLRLGSLERERERATALDNTTQYSQLDLLLVSFYRLGISIPITKHQTASRKRRSK
ncbi:hypothetical protein MA16_Dca012293 [Dendrobium catenatum]|uniref:Uncharacterized protein n=1 Tax=Dendrobium catenatum TaxID=906689 RepID=A0A2I0WR87_9ASPA|nr:hypothetical protein MA16_Dca012293 [Dendrobium catenatum]